MSSKPVVKNDLVYIALDDILVNQDQNVRSVVGAKPLTKKEEEELSKDDARRVARRKYEELLTSIETQGLLQPVIVQAAPEGSKKPYTLVDGYRRMAAVKELQAENRWAVKLPDGTRPAVGAVVMKPGRVGDKRGGERVAAIMAGIATASARAELTWYDMADSAAEAVKLGAKQGEIATACGISPSYMSNLVHCATDIQPEYWAQIKEWARSGVTTTKDGKPLVDFAYSLKSLDKAQQEERWAAVIGKDEGGEGTGNGGGTPRPSDRPYYAFPPSFTTKMHEAFAASQVDLTERQAGAAEVLAWLLGKGKQPTFLPEIKEEAPKKRGPKPKGKNEGDEKAEA